MNTLESYMTDNPAGIVEECAKLTIEDTTIPFLLAGVTEPDSEYTFSFWVKSNINSTITAAETTFPTTSKWTKHHFLMFSLVLASITLVVHFFPFPLLLYLNLDRDFFGESCHTQKY